MDLLVEIPAVVAVDVKGDLLFDLSKLPGPSSPNDCEHVFPPGSACKLAIYDPTGERSITVAVFDNSEKGSTILEERVAPDWSGAAPGQVSTTDLQARPINDTQGKSLQPLKTSLAEVARIAAQGRWTTLTRSFRLVAPASSLMGIRRKASRRRSRTRSPTPIESGQAGFRNAGCRRIPLGPARREPLLPVSERYL